MSEWVDFKAVKAQVGIEAVLGHYSLKLRRVNASSLRGRCPLPSHVSKKRAESFGVNVDKNVWACQSASYMEGRGGRKGGNVLDFVAHMEGCSVRDAALNLNHWFNVQDDQDDLTTVATETAVRRPPSRKQGKKLAAKEKSPEGESEGENKVLGFELKGIDSSHAYLKTRGIKPETADHFGVGFFPGKGSMKGRVVFPIRNPAGELVGYAGRSIDDSEPRYKVPGGLKKSLLLWGLDSAVASQKARGAVVVVEGLFAAMKLHQAGFEQVVALMGTTLSEDQEELLLEHFDRVVLLLDGDEAGRLASREIGVTSRNGKNRTLRPIERRAGPELALFNLLVQPPAMVQNIVGKELDRLGHARVGVPGSGRSCSPGRSRCGDRAWRSPGPSLSGRTL